MEKDLNPVAQPDHPVVSACARCGVNAPEEGYVNQFCNSCRVALSRHPFPRWIWLFAGGVFCIMLIGLFRMPRYAGAAIHLGRGEKAMENHKYKTAEKELKQVLSVLPESQRAHIDMFIAATYSLDILQMQQEYLLLKDQKVDDHDQYAGVEKAMTFLQSIMPGDSAIAEKITIASKDSVTGLLRLADTIAAGNPDPGALHAVADRLYEMKAYTAAEDVLQKIFQIDKNAYTALHLLAAIRRQQGRFDEALAVCSRVLNINREDVGAYAQMAKIEMKRKNDRKAADYIAQGQAIDKEDITLMEADAMLAHFTGRENDSRKLAEQLKSAEPDSEKMVYNRLEKIIDGTEKYR